MFPFWIDLSFSSLVQCSAIVATTSWMFFTWFGGRG